MGLLDILQGNPSFTNDPGVTNLPNPALWGALNQPSPLQALIDQIKGQPPTPQDASAYGSMGVDPSATYQPAAPQSPFPQQPQQPAAPTPPPSGFGATAPFSFAGPGSMNVNPASIQPPQAPQPQPAPQPSPQPAPAVPPAVASAMASDPQASPIAVGSYQMPRVGSADDFEPDDDIPANAKPAQGTLPAGGTAPFSLAGPGIGDRLSAAASSIQHSSGLIPSLINGATALASGQRTDEQSIGQNATAQALRAKGADPADIAAAAHDPKLMQALINQYYGKDKFQQSKTKNADGSETKDAFDVNTGKYTGTNAPAPPNKFSVDPQLTGKDRLEAIRAVDPLYAKKLESMIAGDFPMPTGVAALRPDAKRTVEDVLSIDGAMSASDFKTKADTRKDYASGIASRVTKSINTTIGHFATLDQAIDKLGNYTYLPHIANAVHDAYSSNLDPAYQKAKATFEANKEAAVKELDFALSGGHSSVSGSAELRDKFNRADSPEALHAAVTEAMSLLQKRLESHTKAFNEGTKSQRDAQDFIYPENQQAFGKLLGQPQGGGAPGGSAATPPGNYVWTPTGGLVGGK